MKKALAAVCAMILAGSAGIALAAGFVPEPVRTARIDYFLIGRSQTRFGEFEFAGGLTLNSTNRAFGGLSGIDFRPDGKSFVAISDNGYWFRGTLEREEGRLVGIRDAEWAPMLNGKGNPLGAKRNADAEGLRLTTIDGREAAYVSFEQTNELRLYRANPDLSLARPEPVKLPRSATGLVKNRGLETVALAPAEGPLAGSPVLVSERSLDRKGNHRSWIVRGPLAGAFSVVRSDDFDVTDGAFLPNGDLLLLERRVIMPFGVGMRLRRIAGDSIRPGALVDGPVVMQADMLNQIDNMESLAVTTDEQGRARITLVSDDNLSILQRTLILEFIWQGPGGSAGTAVN
ncbi:esterase-like activity of phytase family protein [Kaistia sp. MMO-174]|uniref:esterase-like activity of phytase family protein n=1 Tax=Kaistia sp. MMO-174 TaxID=3081256 RepID=UPI0030186BC3